MSGILFLTSTNLAANPRLLKELKLATANGFSATVLQFTVGNWSDAMTTEMQNEFPDVDFITLSALRKPFLPWLLSSAFHKLCNIVPLAMRTDLMLSVSAGKRSFLLMNQLKKIKKKPDWVIAHNPAAFYAACWYGKQKGAKVGIDVEDYHPGETNDVKESRTVKELMRKVLPNAVYCSFASPLIMKYVEQDIAFTIDNRNKLVNNVFSMNDFPVPVFEDKTRSKLRVVWFSQFVDYGRGL
jgi:hypothetical protein